MPSLRMPRPARMSRRAASSLFALLAALALVAPPALWAQAAARGRTVAERLGHPAGTKLLIVHADDLGAAHSINAASFDALDRGTISSASVMIPTPWVTEVAAYARRHPEHDIGLHLTLTSEWLTYRWGSVAPADKVTSLLDSAGTLWPGTQRVAAARVAEAEREIRAQVERAHALGIRPTHLDSHMGALFTTPELFAAYVKVARDYKLPFLGGLDASAGLDSGRARRKPPLLDSDVLVDAVVQVSPQVPRERWKAFYVQAIADLKPGLTEMIVHLGHDDAELRAVTVDHEDYGSAWRQRDTDVVNSPEFRQALKDHGVVLVRWRDLRALAQQQP